MAGRRRAYLNDQRTLKQMQRREMQQLLENDVSSDDEEAKKRLASYPPVSHEQAEIIVAELLGADVHAYPWERLEYCVKHLRYWINMQDDYTLSLTSNEKLIGVILSFFKMAFSSYQAALQQGDDTAPSFTVLYETTWLLSSLSYYSHIAERLLYQNYEMLMEFLFLLSNTTVSETLCIVILNITSSRQIRLTPLECVSISRFFYSQLVSGYPTILSKAKASQGTDEKIGISFVQRYATYILGNLVYALLSHHEMTSSFQQSPIASDDDYYELDCSSEEDLARMCYFNDQLHHPYMCPSVVAGTASISLETAHELAADFASRHFIQQTIFMFRAYAHIFEQAIHIFLCVSPANGPFLNRLLYLLNVLLEGYVILHWSCAELKVAYSVPFIDKLFALLRLRRKNLTFLVISTLTKIMKSLSSYRELEEKERIDASCTDNLISVQAESFLQPLQTSTYSLHGPPDSPDLYRVITQIFTDVPPLISSIDTQISSRAASLLTYIITHFQATIYMYQDLFNTYLKILKGIPIHKAAQSIYTLTDRLTSRNCTYMPEIWQGLYEVLIYFFTNPSTQDRFKDIISGSLAKLIEAYPETAESFLSVGGESLLADYMDHPNILRIIDMLNIEL